MNQKIELEPTQIMRERGEQYRTLKTRLVKIFLPVLIILLGMVATWLLMTSTPKAERVAKPREARLVETMSVDTGNEAIRITAWGEVKPAQEVVIKAQVSGVVESLLHSLEPGSFVAASQPLLQLEQAQYQAALIQAQATLEQAMAEREIEQGNQAVARSEFALLGGSVSDADKKRMLREPQLQVASAQVKSAEAALSAARLDLNRTAIRAPFSAVIKERHVNIGSHVAVNGEMVTLTGTGSAWVEVSVPINELQWIRFPDAQGSPGSPVTLFYDQVWAAGQQRTGTVVRLLSDLESSGRMARVLVEVNDPLALQPETLGQPPLLMGSFVRAELQGKQLDDVVVIPAALLRENDTVWVYQENQLKVRPVTVVYRDQSHVYVREGIRPGDQLVTSALSTVSDGMPVRISAEQGGTTP